MAMALIKRKAARVNNTAFFIFISLGFSFCLQHYIYPSFMPDHKHKIYKPSILLYYKTLRHINDLILAM